MTRLKENDIDEISMNWPDFEKDLFSKTGHHLLEAATGLLNFKTDPQILIKNHKVAVVPVSSGEGFISGFAESLASIARHLGFDSFICQPDSPGFEEARSKGATMTLSADDNNFLAKSVNLEKISENGSATGRGFAEILRLMAGKNFYRGEILVIGCGPVGQAAGHYLKSFGGRLNFLDLDEKKSSELAEECSGRFLKPEILKNGLPTHIKYIIDASTAASLLKELPKDVLVAAPGVPLAWPQGKNVWHDPLQTGTAVMLLELASLLDT